MMRERDLPPPRDAGPEWGRLLAEQHGVVDTAQLAALGVSSDLLKAHVMAGRWRPMLPGVYLTRTGTPTREQWLHAALRYGRPHAVLSHRTAAEEWGMVPVADGPVHVTVPYGSSAVSQPGVIVHRSRAFAHLVVAATPPRTARADTLIDLAAAEPTARDAMRCFVGLLTTTSVSLPEVERRLAERPPRRYRGPLRRALERVAGGGGVGSPLEDLYLLDVEAAHALPLARRQVPVAVDGRTLYEDATYDHVGVPLTVRLDGRAYHANAGIAFRDRRRDNAGELAGRARLAFGWRDIDDDPCGVAGEVLAILRRDRWHGPVRPCPRCS